MKTIDVTTPLVMSMVCAGIGLFLSACTHSDKLPADVVGAYEQAFNRDDIAACMALFTDDAQILPEHGPIVTGREGIEQFLKDQMTPVAAFNTETEMTLVRRDLAIEQGHYRVRDVRRGSDVEEGKYLHVWRNVGGDWKLYRIIYNTDVEPAAKVSVAEAQGEQ
jgi:ketosteroid isomerase-like protein